MELTQRLLERIAKVDATLKSYATITADQGDCRGACGRGRDTGRQISGTASCRVPVAAKDLVISRGVRTMGGTPVRKDFVPAFDGTVVSNLRRADAAVVLGKLNLSEGATAGYNPAPDVPLNPWNLDRWPGMSSSGSGVAVAGLTVRRHRHRHRRIDSQFLVRQRGGWTQADAWSCQSIRRAGDGRLARSRRPDGAPRR